MATDAAAVRCPVCGEGFREAPARCFRCESDLELWWPLDESLRALDGETYPVSGPAVSGAARVHRWLRRNLGWLTPLVLLCGLAGALWLSLESTRPPAPLPFNASPAKATPIAEAPLSPAVASAAPLRPSPRTIRYVVQPGDSRWRIAAALLGDARRWPELLPATGADDAARLRPGQELRLVLDDAGR